VEFIELSTLTTAIGIKANNIPFIHGAKFAIITSAGNAIMQNAVTSSSKISFHNVPLVVSSTNPVSGTVPDKISLVRNSTVLGSSVSPHATAVRNALKFNIGASDNTTAIQNTTKTATSSASENIMIVKDTMVSIVTISYGRITDIQNSTPSSKCPNTLQQ
jgi:hypothetical protein